MQEIQLNTATLTALTHLCLGPMVASRNGVVINVASLTAFQPTPYMAVYGATKAYVLSFTEVLWAEYRSQGVRIVALCPGETSSSFHQVSGTDDLKDKRMEPEEVVQAAFRAVDQDRSSTIAGRQNYMLAQLPRRFPTDASSAPSNIFASLGKHLHVGGHLPGEVAAKAWYDQAVDHLIHTFFRQS